MEFAQLNRNDAEKVFIGGRNITGATVSAGIPVEWAVETVTDGNSFTAAKSGSLSGLFAGITDAPVMPVRRETQLKIFWNPFAPVGTSTHNCEDETHVLPPSRLP